MADMFLNLEVSGGGAGGRGGRAEHGNSRHQQFVRKRKFLERRGYLKQKQLPAKLANKKPGQHSTFWEHSKPSGQRGDPAHHPQGTQEPDVCQRGATSRSGETLNVRVAPNHARVATFTSNHTPAKGPRPAHQGPMNGHVLGAKNQSKPSFQLPSSALLSEFSSGIPSATPTASYKIVAVDCEMVGTGHKGSVSALARCSIVGYHGDVMYDKYIKPANPVTDYRTRWSGIRREHLVNALPFAAAQKEILKILQGKTVIGHAIQNDYKALGYFHPKEMTRDTSKIALLNRKAGFPEHEMASLKRLAKQLLHKDIQTGRGGHSSVEDAKTTMELYRVVEAEYERELASA